MNSRPIAYEANALPLSYTGVLGKSLEPTIGLEPMMWNPCLQNRCNRRYATSADGATCEARTRCLVHTKDAFNHMNFRSVS